MGFFKGFKDDLSQAVNELLPGDHTVDVSDQMVNTLDSEIEASNEAAESEMKEWLEEFAQDMGEEEVKDEDSQDDTEEDIFMVSTLEEDIDNLDEEILNEVMEDEVEDMGQNVDENVDLELLDALNAEDQADEKNEIPDEKVNATSLEDEEVTVISKGTTITGNISSDGSLNIMGNVTGDIECLGKLSITGKIVGNCTAAEVYVNTERLEGGINSEGSVKIGLGTVVVGDIIGTSGVITGAVKGEIDINGPIVIDSTAIIKGNIKAKSVQINNGAVIEGFCSLSYSDIDMDNVF